MAASGDGRMGRRFGRSRWRAAIAVLAIAGPVGWALHVGVWPATTYIALIEALVLMLVALGWAAMGTPAGVLVNARNCVSLSRLQIAAWTAMVVAALAGGVIWNAWIGVAQPLDIDIPDEVLEALGIAAASFVAAPALLGLKDDADPRAGDIAAATAPAGGGAAGAPAAGAQAAGIQAAAATGAVAGAMAADAAAAGDGVAGGDAAGGGDGVAGGDAAGGGGAMAVAVAAAAVPVPAVVGGAAPAAGAAPASVGSLFARTAAVGARWADLVRGDDLATARQIDLGKVQQLLITVLLISVYGIAVWNALIGVHAGFGLLAATPWPPVPPGAGAAAMAQAHAAVAQGQTVLAHCREVGFMSPDGKRVDPACAAAVLSGLPAMNTKFVWLLAISHAGYLGTKTVDNKAPAPQ